MNQKWQHCMITDGDNNASLPLLMWIYIVFSRLSFTFFCLLVCLLDCLIDWLLPKYMLAEKQQWQVMWISVFSPLCTQSFSETGYSNVLLPPLLPLVHAIFLTRHAPSNCPFIWHMYNCTWFLCSFVFVACNFATSTPLNSQCCYFLGLFGLKSAYLLVYNVHNILFFTLFVAYLGFLVLSQQLSRVITRPPHLSSP